jgi:hypothetical protein
MTRNATRRAGLIGVLLLMVAAAGVGVLAQQRPSTAAIAQSLPEAGFDQAGDEATVPINHRYSKSESMNR